MTEEKNFEGIAAYVGVSAPETPKYLLTNNFLLHYFKEAKNDSKHLNFELFKSSGVLYTEDSENEELLQKSFDCFLYRYLGEETMREGNHRLRGNKHFYFPLIQEMLTGSTHTLRHLLFHLQVLDEEYDYKVLQNKLEQYIFCDSSGINHILKILFQNENGEVKYAERLPKDETAKFWNLQTLTSAENSKMEKLGSQLNKDLLTLLSHEYFCKLDFYRRYNYLSILLTSYVIQYIVWRKGSNVGILCKGNPQDERLTGLFHKACCNNYTEIRSLFSDLLKKYYVYVVKEQLEDGKQELLLFENDGIVYVENEPCEEFVDRVLKGRKSRSQMGYGNVKKAFALEEGQEKSVNIDEFVLRYIDLTGTRKGSVLTKMSSILPTSGRQIEMIFPNSNARQKYFAMSGSLAEFYVRLYLAGKGQKYDYLDNFIEHLQKRYRICLVRSREGDRMLNKIRPKLSAMDYAKNKAAFIETLHSVNCLIKLSDSGYVITLPEEKGDFKLI